MRKLRYAKDKLRCLQAYPIVKKTKIKKIKSKCI